MNEFKRFAPELWDLFGKHLLREGSDEQHEDSKVSKQIKFLEACHTDSAQEFLAHIDQIVESVCTDNNIRKPTIGTEELVVESKLCESQFFTSPQNLQQKIWDTFKDIPNETAIDGGFWGYVVYNMIQKGHIKPSYLAATINRDGNGHHNITEALKADKKASKLVKKQGKGSDEATDDQLSVKIAKHHQAIDKCVRRILRSLCNPAPRGKRIIFNDFPLGKSFWRWKWADKMSQERSLGLDSQEILTIFDATSYGDFSAKMHTGRSYISSPNIFGGLLLFLKATKSGKKALAQLVKKELVNIIDHISYLSAWKALEAQPFEKNRDDIQIIFDSLQANANTESPAVE